MKRLLAVFLSINLVLSGYTSVSASSKPMDPPEESFTVETEETPQGNVETEDNAEVDFTLSRPMNVSFSGLDDAELLSYIKNEVYAELVQDLNSEDYFVENVDAIFISREYIEELSYNSGANLYFGYTLQELSEQFRGQRYIFTVGEDGATEVREMETFYNNSTEQIIKNIAVGSGVILICVTVSVVSMGAGAPAVSMIFTAGAKTGTTMALSSSLISGAAATLITAYQTNDMKEAFKQGTLAASEGFKYCAMIGAVSGGASTAYALHGATASGLNMNEVAKIQMESGYPLDVIKQFKSVDEYNIYRDAGLKAGQIGNRSALVRKIDLDYTVDIDGVQMTNRELMQKGLAPFDSATGKRYQLHHINQNPDGTLAILTEAEHQGNSAILNIFGKESEINRTDFGQIKRRFWKDYAAQCM